MIISKTPLRVSFIGGGTDIPEFYKKYPGQVISSTIDKYVYVMVKERWEDKIRVSYTNNEEIDDLKNLKNTRVKAVLEYFGIEKGIEIVSWADLPAQIGLGGSSAFTVGLVNAIGKFQRNNFYPEQLAEKACKIEIDILKEPIGKQDQYASAIGGFNKFEFDTEGVIKNPISFVENQTLIDNTKINLLNRLLLVYTENPHESTKILKGIINEVNLNILKEIKNMVDPFIQELGKQNWDTVGMLLDKNWEFKKALSPSVSNEKLDQLYLKALKSGAIGGKLLGAGGGGVFMFVGPPEKREQVKNALNL